MKQIFIALVVSGMIGFLPLQAMAEHHGEVKGVERAAEGVVDTVTSPGEIVKEVAEDAEKHGPVGVVTGTVKGTAKGAAKAVTGAAKVGVGAVEAVLSPLTGD